MATAKKQTNGESPIVPVVTTPDEANLAKFTYNVRGFNESLTIRCDDEDELKELRDRWSQVINPPRRKIPYMHSGDECLVADCRGVMIKKTATNRRTQKPYNYLRCSNHPSCTFTSYIEDEQNTPAENGAGDTNGHQNGVTDEQRAVEQVAGAQAAA
jgi:hypothetical protein